MLKVTVWHLPGGSEQDSLQQLEAEVRTAVQSVFGQRAIDEGVVVSLPEDKKYSGEVLTIEVQGRRLWRWWMFRPLVENIFRTIGSQPGIRKTHSAACIVNTPWGAWTCNLRGKE